MDKVDVYKVALTADQIAHYDLPPSMEAKPTSPTYQSFVTKYDSTLAYELEALDPTDFDSILDKAIREVLDLERFNEQLAAEEQDSARIVAVRQQAQAFFKSLGNSGG